MLSGPGSIPARAGKGLDMTVKFFAYLREAQYAGCKEMTCPAPETVARLGEMLSQRFGPAFRREFFCFEDLYEVCESREYSNAELGSVDFDAGPHRGSDDTALDILSLGSSRFCFADAWTDWSVTLSVWALKPAFVINSNTFFCPFAMDK